MENSFVETILKKREVDTGHWMKVYNAFFDNEWFDPNNKKDESFTIANSMHDFGLLEKKRIPTWYNGSFLGYKIQFKKLENK